MRIAMIGATGLIGQALAPRLAVDHDLLLIGRRPAGVAGAEERIAPMDEWSAVLAGEAIDVAISTLGTTIRQAGNWEAFRAVDATAVLRFARAARAAGARQMLSVSSVGANAGARNNYLAMKGAAEDGLAALGFERLDIIRPGLLRGDRGDDRRLGERIGSAISPVANLLLRGRLDRFAAIDGERVAAGIAALVGAKGNGRRVHFNREIIALVT